MPLIIGTKDHKLVKLIESVYIELELENFDTVIEVDVVDMCQDFASGYTSGDDEYINIEVAKEDLMGDIPEELIAKTLCHEMVHAKQIAENRLELLFGLTKFEGSTFDSSVPYNERPWEKEAYEQEDLIYKKVKNDI